MSDAERRCAEDTVGTMSSPDAPLLTRPCETGNISNSRVRVFARVRPTLAPTNAGPIAVDITEETHAIRVIADSTLLEQRLAAGASSGEVAAEAREFVFDGVFNLHATQDAVFSEVGAPVLEECFKGYNGTIFAYGQTGSGKTYSLLQKGNDDETIGLLPRLAVALFNKAAEDPTKIFDVEVAAVQVYNEQVDDLLHPSYASGGGHGVGVQNTGAVAGLTWLKCKRAERLLRIIDRARSNLVYAETKMNKASSRSHALFQLKLIQRSAHGDCVECRSARLNVVDLAGSERVKKSGAEGIQFKEAAAINTSLLALGNVVSALAAKKGHVPFRDSKLTRLLEGSLGGNCKTVLLVCVSPSVEHAPETVCTLEFASRAMRVETNARANVSYINVKTNAVSEDIAAARLQEVSAALQAEEAIEQALRRDVEIAESRADAAEEEAIAWKRSHEEAEARTESVEMALHAERVAADKQKSLAARALTRAVEQKQEALEHVENLESQLARNAAELAARTEELCQEAETIQELKSELLVQAASRYKHCETYQEKRPARIVKNDRSHDSRHDCLDEMREHDDAILQQERAELATQRAALELERRAVAEERAWLSLKQSEADAGLSKQNSDLQEQVDDLRKRCKLEQKRRLELVENHEEDRQRLASMQSCMDSQRRQLCARIQETEELRRKLAMKNYALSHRLATRSAELVVGVGSRTPVHETTQTPSQARVSSTPVLTTPVGSDAVCMKRQRCLSAQPRQGVSSLSPTAEREPMKASPQRTKSANSLREVTRPLSLAGEMTMKHSPNKPPLVPSTPVDSDEPRLPSKSKRWV
eukprot:TRINITY_DN26188_c0_g5_i1.p1 TRINITY_DN26188_c0_g5~~TRINITY_DN26188_c0_g5_i1.p1  ORF type:complete len:822 (+),score=102.78 TRINITY_DN26188_c0_g5_i1:69-2534(+)